MRFVSESCVGALALSLAATSFAGPNWVEDGDAGSTIASAQKISNVKGGQVQKIIGSLTGSAEGFNAAGLQDDFEDLYELNITDPGSFMLSTAPEFGGQSNFQTSLWLFDAQGFGLLGNVYSPQSPLAGEFGDPQLGSTLLNHSTDGTGIVITEPGIYYVAITGVPNHPLAGGVTEGADMFWFDSFDEISGPDGPGGHLPFTCWWWGEGETGDYTLVVEGVSEVPAPGVLSLLLVSAACGRGRRRTR